MAETTVLKSSASPKKPQSQSAEPTVQTSGPLPVVKVNMNQGRPQGAAAPHKNVFILNNRPAKGQPTTPVVQMPSGLTVDQLLLCRHLVDLYLTQQRGEGGNKENAQLAEETLIAIDHTMAAGNAPVKPMVVISGTKAASSGAVAPRRVIVQPKQDEAE